MSLRSWRRHIPGRFPRAELVAVGVAVAVLAQHGTSAGAIALAVSCIGMAAAAAIDATTRRLPNAIVGLVAATELAAFQIATQMNHEWAHWWRALEAAGIAGALMLTVYVLTRGGLGEGDVKFAPVVWLPLGWLGWSSAFAGYLVAAVVATAMAVVMSVRRRRWRGVTIPFGPALALGAIITIVADLHWPPGGVR
ncbi:unannotated protein [freshwater metagenome]|uniref:Unannotated protein n=1 Tax=freshwater metagenome TaxID=449393 RepID=A0A6J7F3S7_9ZZZZ